VKTLSKEEVDLVQEGVLFQFEGAIAFEDAHMGLLDPAIEPPVVIHTVPHDSSTLATSKPAATQSDARRGYSACQGQTTTRNSLAIESRDLTAFLTAVGLVRITRLPQGWTNSIAVFQHIITCGSTYDTPNPFSTMSAFGPDTEDETTVAPGIRKFVLEHVKILEGIMRDIRRSGLTIAVAKTSLAMRGINWFAITNEGIWKRGRYRRSWVGQLRGR
jgi:hypothetical protein